MSVNLDKYKDSLVGAWKEVMDEKHSTDWAIFGYEGQTFDLKLVSKGDDGLDGMVEDFNSGKIMYGLCRVKLKERNMEKIALINWQGEGAPLARKGTCANHVGTIKNFFKGVHVTINARTDEEVEPSVIIETVGKSTAADGVKMSSSLEMDDPKVGPIGAIYKRVNPQEEINSKMKDEFWRQEQAAEERRKKDEQDKIRKFSQNEVKLLRRESQEYFNEQERASSTSSSTPISSPSPTLVARTNGNGTRNGGADSSSPTPPAFSNAFMATEKAAVLKASAPRKNSASENLVRQRIKSFDGNPNESLSFQYQSNGGTTNGNRSPATKNGDASPDGESLSVLRRKQMFESGRVSNSASNLIRKDPAEEIKSLQAEAQVATPKAQVSTPKFQEPAPKAQEAAPKAQEAAPKAQDPVIPKAQEVAPKAQEPILHTQETVTNSPADKTSKMHEAPARVESPIRRTPSPQKPPPPSLNRKSPSPVPIKSPSPQPVKAYNLPFHIGGGVSEKLAEKINKNSDNGLGSTGSNYSYEEPTISASTPPPPTNKDYSRSPAFEDRTIKSAEVSPSVVNEVVERISTPVIEGTASPALEIKPEMGLCARALYDYQAADDSEITFDPGEVITNIETIDEGWWEGMGPQGVYGLFPANYVELLN